MEDKISIIVPIYNVKNYLKRCVESIINQTYKNIEIILVNDGSTDESGKICDDFATKDDRIKVIHKKNGGLSDARNSGIDNATGEILSFIDSDDYIEQDMIERLYNAMKKDESDICCCAKVLDYPDKSIVKNNGGQFCIDNEEALKRLFTFNEIDTSACDKIFRKQLFETIRFPKDKYYEDMGTIYKVFGEAKVISHIPDIGYHYCIRKNSISKEKFSIKQMDSLLFAKQANDDIEIKFPKIQEAANAYYYLELINILVKIKKADNFKEFKETYEELKSQYNQNIKKILKNKYIPAYKKIMALFIYFNLYKVVIMLKRN